MDGTYMDHVRGVIEEEFHRIGMKIEVININVARDPVHLRGSYQPVGYSQGMATMEVEFYCNEMQFEYLSPFVERYMQDDVHIYPDVGWSTQHHFHDSLNRPQIKTEARYRCTIILHLTGGSMQTFIESFREATTKLFIAMESKAFDEEVVKTLTEE